MLSHFSACYAYSIRMCTPSTRVLVPNEGGRQLQAKGRTLLDLRTRPDTELEDVLELRGKVVPATLTDLPARQDWRS
jgi:hypothetical protein